MSSPEAIANSIESPLALKKAKIKEVRIPSEVQQFCIENNLSGALDLAQKFVIRCFSGIQALKLRLVVDPEDDEKWVKINIIVPDTANFLTEYNNYTRLLVAEIPWPEETCYGSILVLPNIWIQDLEQCCNGSDREQIKGAISSYIIKMEGDTV